MSLFGCNFKCNCTAYAVIASVIIGVLTTFLQITGVITATPVFLWVAFGIAVVYLAILVLAAARMDSREQCCSPCNSLAALLTGILGTILLAVILLAVGIIATSLVSAILVGVLLFFFALMITGTACFIRCLADCGA